MRIKPCLQLPENALAVAEEFYRTCGRPAFERELPDYVDDFAFGLVGEGSDCYGYDDKISADHDYGPSFCVWLTHDDYEMLGPQAQRIYRSLPQDFKGLKPRTYRATGMDRVGVLDINAFYGKFLGRPTPPTTNMEWLRIPENYLAVATNGKVFEDRRGEFTRIREALLQFYPEPVRQKKLAARVLKMAHSGQCNYARIMRRGDIVAAYTAVHEFIENAIAAIYLLNRVYSPYYKWRFRYMEHLTLLQPCRDLLEELAGLGSTASAWEDETTVLDFNVINMADRKIALMEEVSAQVAAELRRQGLSTLNDAYLEPHAFHLQQNIADPQLRSLSIMMG